MGKRKIEIKKIDNAIKCQVTFSKRRSNLMKKAHEISILCDVDIALVIFSANSRLYDFCSRARMEEVIQRYLNLPQEKRFHPTKNIQRNSTCLCHKAEKLKQLDHIRGDENKLSHLKNQIKDLELQIKKSTAEIESLHNKLKDYEPNPKQNPVATQLRWIEKNLKTSLELVKDRKTKLICKPSSYRRRSRVQRKQKKEMVDCTPFSHSFNGIELSQPVQQNPSSSDRLQMQSDPWISLYSRSEVHDGSIEELLDQFSGCTLAGNGLVGFPSNFTGNLISYYPGSSSSSTMGTQIPPAYSPPFQFNVPGGPGFADIGVLENYSAQKSPAWKRNNLNCQNLVSPTSSHFQANSNELNWIANGTFNTNQNSEGIFSFTHSQPYSTTATAAAINSCSINNNGGSDAGPESLSNEAGRGDGTLCTTRNPEEGSWNLDDINWDIELSLEDLDILLG